MPSIGEIIRKRKPSAVVNKHPLIPDVGFVGIELELEGVPNPPRIKRWKTERDGSLRNHGVEYILAKPTGGDDLLKAIMNADRVLNRINPEVNFRCSTHVHIDVRDLTEEQFRKLILAGVYYEDYFLSIMGGDDRGHNTYCPSTSFAMGYLGTLNRLFDRPVEDGLFGTRWCKYTQMNLKTTLELGSLEFRGSEGKWASGVLLRLVLRYMHLKRIAIEHQGSFEEFIDMMHNSDPKEIFGNAAPAWIPLFEESRVLNRVKCLEILKGE